MIKESSCQIQVTDHEGGNNMTLNDSKLVELNPELFHDLQHLRLCTDLVLGVALLKGYIDD